MLEVYEKAHRFMATWYDQQGFNNLINSEWEWTNKIGFDILLEIIEFSWDLKKGRSYKGLGTHTREEWETKKRQYDYRCLYCGKKFSRLTKDHMIPVSKGGMNTIDNIFPACGKCNKRKHDKDLVDFQEGITLKFL